MTFSRILSARPWERFATQKASMLLWFFCAVCNFKKNVAGSSFRYTKKLKHFYDLCGLELKGTVLRIPLAWIGKKLLAVKRVQVWGWKAVDPKQRAVQKAAHNVLFAISHASILSIHLIYGGKIAQYPILAVDIHFAEKTTTTCFDRVM